MSPVLLILILLVLVAVTGLGLVVSRRRGSGLEPPSPPPAARPPVAPADAAPVAVPTEPEAVEPEAVEVPERAAERPRFRDRLGRARDALSGYLGAVAGRSSIDTATWEELEEALILADVGMSATTALLDDLRARVRAQGLRTGDELLGALKAELVQRLDGFDRDLHLGGTEGPSVWLFVGVNGVGKTTTIGKLGAREVAAGHRVVMAAGDTFRAAAAEQLGMWAERAGAELVRGDEGVTPAPSSSTG